MRTVNDLYNLQCIVWQVMLYGIGYNDYEYIKASFDIGIN